ncbi:putative ATP-grasp-modified RiPP [Streptomyces sp. bgisy100]|uniref:putative ATP-grasp-modified RiPP n=1 Tax=Streptomyces sp. bgisy100 TaxID=3413783 RepID=UPI003D745C85
MKPFTWNFAQRSQPSSPVTMHYSYDHSLQLNVLPDGRPAISDKVMLAAAGTTTSTAGSATHFDD